MIGSYGRVFRCSYFFFFACCAFEAPRLFGSLANSHWIGTFSHSHETKGCTRKSPPFIFSVKVGSSRWLFFGNEPFLPLLLIKQSKKYAINKDYSTYVILSHSEKTKSMITEIRILENRREGGLMLKLLNSSPTFVQTRRTMDQAWAFCHEKLLF